MHTGIFKIANLILLCMPSVLHGHGLVFSTKDSSDAKVTSIDAIRNFVPHNTISKAIKSWMPCLDSMFQVERKENMNTGVIQNLGEYIDSLGKLGCFILINNFHGINLENFNHLVVVRRPRPVVLLSKLGSFDIELFWVPQHLYPTNGTADVYIFLEQECKLSKFLVSFWRDAHTIPNLADYCLRIIQHVLAFSTKPWNCEVQFGLFPLLKLYDATCDLQYYPRPFQMDEANEGIPNKMLSLTVPTVHIILTHAFYTTEMKSLQTQMLASHVGLQRGDNMGETYVYQSVFFHGCLKQAISTKITQQPQFSIDHLKLVRISYQNSLLREHRSTQIFIGYTLDQFNSEKLSQTLSLTSAASPEEMLVWKAYGGLSCYTGKFPIAEEQSIIEVVSEYRNKTWLSIFGNYTFALGRGTHCTNGVEETFTPWNRLRRHSWMYLTWFRENEVYKPFIPMA